MKEHPRILLHFRLGGMEERVWEGWGLERVAHMQRCKRKLWLGGEESSMSERGRAVRINTIQALGKGRMNILTTEASGQKLRT